MGDFLKKVLSVILAVILLLSSFSVVSFASFNSLLETEADVVLLINTDSETVIFDKNADKQTAPAYLAQIVTCMLVLENCSDFSTPITCTKEHLAGLYEQKAPTVGILAGETLTVNELLYCMMIQSAADAANMLADYIGDGIPNFVDTMNEYAKNLGCTNTKFINAHGCDDNGGGYTTANDMYLITKSALENATFKELVNTTYKEIAPTAKYPKTRYLNSTNSMLIKGLPEYYYKAVSGVKAGRTDDAGCCVVSTASQDGYNYMLIVMNAPRRNIDDDEHLENFAFLDSVKIYKWAFKNIVLTKVTNLTDVVTVVDVEYNSKVDHLRLVPSEEISALVPSGTETSSLVIRPIEKETPKTVKAPIKKGDVIGKAEILYGNDVVATVNLVAAEDVKLNVFLWIIGLIKTIISSLIFKILFAIFVILLVIYILLIVRKNRIKAKRKKIRKIKG